MEFDKKPLGKKKPLRIFPMRHPMFRVTISMPIAMTSFFGLFSQCIGVFRLVLVFRFEKVQKYLF